MNWLEFEVKRSKVKVIEQLRSNVHFGSSYVTNRCGNFTKFAAWCSWGQRWTGYILRSKGQMSRKVLSGAGKAPLCPVIVGLAAWSICGTQIRQWQQLERISATRNECRLSAVHRPISIDDNLTTACHTVLYKTANVVCYRQHDKTT